MLDLDLLVSFLRPSLISTDEDKAGYCKFVTSEDCSLQRQKTLLHYHIIRILKIH